MKTVKIVWNADQRELPRIGVVSKGDVVKVPDHEAKSYVHQGIAIPHKQKQEQSK